jgi:small-conductance mechanosensitive channel
MGDLLSETTALWTIAVVLGYPILALGLVEAYRHARTGYPELARLINLLQVSVLPFVALHVLMKRVAEVPPDNTAAKLVLTALSISGINALLLGLNLLVRIGPAANEALARTPGLVLDLIRLVLVLVASAFVASTIWTVDLGSLMAALGVGSVVIGLALQDTMSGLFSGVSLMSGRHFREGDWIEYGSSSGKIVKLDWRSVTIETLDDERLIVIPNSALAQGGFTVLASSTRVFGQNIYVAACPRHGCD